MVTVGRWPRECWSLVRLTPVVSLMSVPRPKLKMLYADRLLVCVYIAFVEMLSSTGTK